MDKPTTGIGVDGYRIEIDAAAGSKIVRSKAVGRSGAEDLTRALRQVESEPDEPRSLLSEAEKGVEEAEEATRQLESLIQRAHRVVSLLVDGADPRTLAREISELSDKALQYYGEGRLREALRLMRVLSRALLLAYLWKNLVEELVLVLRAARLLGDKDAEAWALHELGTLTVAAGDTDAGCKLLTEAKEIREAAGDHAGAELTTGNLKVASAPPTSPATGFSQWIAAHKLAAGAASAVVVVGTGVASGFAAGSGLWYGIGGDRSGETPKVTGPEDPGTTDPGQSGQIEDACTLITLEEAERAMLRTTSFPELVRDLTVDRGPECVYISAGGDELWIDQPIDNEETRERLRRMVLVSGAGDEAFYDAADDRIYVGKGGKLISLQLKTGRDKRRIEDELRTLARLAASRL